MSRAPSVIHIRNRLRPYFRRLGIKRMPELIFDNRRHHFSQWGLSHNGPWWYWLSPEHNRGAIGEGSQVLARFPLWQETPAREVTYAGHTHAHY